MGAPSKRTRASVLLLFAAAVLIAGCSGNAPMHEGIRDVHGLAVDPNDPTILYVATHHGLFRGQHDQGWARVTKEPMDLMGFTMHPTRPQIMYASGHPARLTVEYHHLGVVRSDDGGATWTTIAMKNEVDFHALAISPADPDRIWAWYYRDADVYESDDAGTTWSKWAPTGLTGEINALAGDARNASAVYAGGTSGLFVSRDEGHTWANTSAPTGILAAATTRANPDLLWIATDDGALVRSTDGGNGWREVSDITWPVDDWPAALAIDPTRSSTVYAASGRGAIYKSVDAGDSWTRVRQADAAS